MRRAEFAEHRLETAIEILDAARYGHLATVAPDGHPEIRAMNYARVGNVLYLHSALPQPDRVVLAVEDTVDWIPSYWRHPEMACPATTYYRSLHVRGALRSVESLEEKADALEAFMARYQAEGGFVPMRDARYNGPLKALTVQALNIDDWTCKIKMGQHLQPGQRAAVHEKLIERGDPEDMACAAEMARNNDDLPAAYPEHDNGLLWTDRTADIPSGDVHALLARTYWAADRPLSRVARNLREATVNLAALRDGRVVATARCVALRKDIVWLFDVAVAEAERGRGLGIELMRRFLAHPAVCGARRVFLDTRDAMTLYERFGFEVVARSRLRNSVLMVREIDVRCGEHCSSQTTGRSA